MTRLGYRTQARRVFRQGNGIKPHFQHTPQYFSPICRCSGMCKTSLLDVETVRAQTNSGGSRGGNYPLTVTFSLSRDIETCQYPGGHHKYQSQRDDECNENPGIAHALFGLRQRAARVARSRTCSRTSPRNDRSPWKSIRTGAPGQSVRPKAKATRT